MDNMSSISFSSSPISGMRNERWSLNVIIPMAGWGSRFSKYGFQTDKFLLPMDLQHTKMIEQAILSLGIDPQRYDAHFYLIVREEHIQMMETIWKENHQLQKYQKTILSVSKVTEGPLCSAYLAKYFVNTFTPLLISNSDQVLKWNFHSFFQTAMYYDGCVLTYTPDYPLVLGSVDKHSFVRMNSKGVPDLFEEKKVISKEALVGVHFYRKGRDFVRASEYLFENNIRAPNGEFYLSYTYQALLEMGRNRTPYTIGTYLMHSPREIFYPVGEPLDYFRYYHQIQPLWVYPIDHIVSWDMSEKRPVYEQDRSEMIQTDPLSKIGYGKRGESLFLYGGDENSSYVVVFLEKEPSVKIFHKDAKYILDRNVFYFVEIIPKIHDITGALALAAKDIEEVYEIDLKTFTRGWFLGDFFPSIFRTPKIEMGLLRHSKGEIWPYHYHRKATEYNILVKGSMNVNSIRIQEMDVFVFPPNMISCPQFLDDCLVFCIKIPSCPSDKYIL